MANYRYTVLGLVQGIGFRPFVAELAEELNIVGWVRNRGGIVTIEASGEKEVLDTFIDRVRTQVPTGGFVSDIISEELENWENGESFRIIESDEDGMMNLPFIPADIATCKKCETELLDSSDRRYRHPFISCTVCGPRYSILKTIPYDRDTITMDKFEMCPSCRQEYSKKGNRRRHAQTIACKECGPKLYFDKLNEETTIVGETALTAAIELIKAGGIVAVKDIGGYHLVCSPFIDQAVQSLRILKHREAKAFAVMLEDIDEVAKYAYLNDHEKELLESPAKPIVLVKRKSNEDDFAKAVCLSSPNLGAMLPCNPLQILLVKECGPLVMTSGNASGDTLEIDDEKMIQWLKERMDSHETDKLSLAVLYNDREILRPQDDSVVKSVVGKTQFIRRARGYVPNPIKVDISGEVFAAGGDLKSTFCFVKEGYAYVSQHLGDLESISCQNTYISEIKAMEEIFGFKPEKKVCDLHPGYYSSKIFDGPLKVQHHKAHVAAVIAEHGLKGPVLGFAFDGTGYGEDGNVWGSEVFSFEDGIIKRVDHLLPVKLIGGDEGARNCKIILDGFLANHGLVDEESIVAKAIKNNINVVESTSMGRLFDAVSCLLGIADYNTYEGQAPIELENVASQAKEYVPLSISEDGNTVDLFKDIIEYKNAKIETEKIAKGFIYAVSSYVLSLAKKYNINQIVLSGGTFLNRILLEKTYEDLTQEGFKVYFANQLPAGDGGLCLGQAYLSNHSFKLLNKKV